MGTDRYAYMSRLRMADPVPKLVFSLAALLVCLFCDSVAVGVYTLVLMSAITVFFAGQSARTVAHFLKIPVAFLLIGCATIVFRPISGESAALCAVDFFGKWRWGVTEEYLRMGLMVFFKAMGTISGMYFLSLSTPMTDIVMALERLHVPRLMTELMELIYRFIFVLSESAGRIHTAQESRLGYTGFRRSINSLGLLSSVVFMSAWRRGDRVWSALESRGYTGALRTVPQVYSPGGAMYALACAVCASQIGVLMLERWLTH